MRSLVLAVALSVTAALAVAAATVDTGSPTPAGYLEAGSTWTTVAPTPTTSAPTTTLATVEIMGVPLTEGTEPESRTPTDDTAPSSTQAPRGADDDHAVKHEPDSLDDIGSDHHGRSDDHAHPLLRPCLRLGPRLSRQLEPGGARTRRTHLVRHPCVDCLLGSRPYG